MTDYQAHFITFFLIILNFSVLGCNISANPLYLHSFFGATPDKYVCTMSDLIKFVEEQNNEGRSNIPSFGPGDTVNVHYKIKEGNKERIQQFQGTVMQIRNTGSNGETFTVRKISGGIAVERIFPMLTPNIDKVEVLRRGKVRRAKLFYLRGRKGKAARIKEKI